MSDKSPHSLPPALRQRVLRSSVSQGAEGHPQAKVPACCHVSARSLTGGLAPVRHAGPKPSEGSDLPRHTAHRSWSGTEPRHTDPRPGFLPLHQRFFKWVPGAAAATVPAGRHQKCRLSPTGDPGCLCSVRTSALAPEGDGLEQRQEGLRGGGAAVGDSGRGRGEATPVLVSVA